MPKSRSGFTLVELLIVIVVIAILAIIGVVTYQGATTRAQASAMATDLKSTEKALRLYFADKGYAAWPREGEEVPNNPSIQWFIDQNDSFKDFMAQAPDPSSGTWEYDNTGDHKDTPCGSENEINQGINIALKPRDKKISEAIDRAIDGGDGNLCGKYRWFTSGSRDGYAYYMIDDGYGTP